MRMDAEQFKMRLRRGALHRFERGPAGQVEAELRILLPGRNVFMRMRFDTGRDAQQNIHALAPFAGQRVEQIELDEVVDDEAADVRVKRQRDFIRRLVVAVEMDPLRREAGLERRVQFAAGDDVQRQPFLLGDGADRHRAERLAGVSDLERNAGGAERVHVLAHALPDERFIDNIERRAEFSRQKLNVAAADFKPAFGIDLAGSVQVHQRFSPCAGSSDLQHMH